SMDEAVGLAVGALNTMGMMSDKPDELAANMTRLSDVMAHTANSAKMSLQDVGAAITAGGSFFKTTANNLDVLSGSLTALAGHSIAGAEAGTALRNIMTNLSAPTAKATKALNAMGIKTTDAAGNLLALPEIIGQFNTAMAGMGDAERNANIYEIFGKQNIAAVTALLDTGQAALENYANAAANATGTVTANAEAMRGSLSNQFKVLLSALTELGFKFVDAFAVQGGDAIKTITEAVSNFDPKPVIDALSTGVTVASSFIKTAWKLRGVIMVVTGVMVAWKVATMGAAIAMKAYNVIMGIAHGAMAAYQIGMGVATAAQTAFNVAVSANPIGLIITGVIAAVAALVALIVLIIKYWDEIVAAVKRFGVAVKEVVTTAIQNVTGFFDGIINKANSMEGLVGTITSILVVPLEMARNLLEGIVNTFTVFTSGGFVDGIKMLGLTIVETLLPPIQKFLDLLSQIPFVGDKFKDFSGELNSWIESSKAGLMPKETVSYGAEDSAGYHPYIPIPTRTAAAANSYSRQETVTTSRVQIGLDNGLKAKGGSNAPGVTINRGGSSGSF
ncbi:MAG: phage tail tape measure protein, partial [Treponema sp.]|nr:phage tail tape measure protein [Treponema sp.]